MRQQRVDVARSARGIFVGQTAAMPTSLDIAALLEDLDVLVLLAGDSGRQRHIDRARAVEAPLDPATSSARELLVVTSTMFTDSVDAGAIRELARRDVAGLCIAAPVRSIDDTLAEVADEVALPILAPISASTAEQLVITILEELLGHHERTGGAAVRGQFAAITLEELISPDPHRNAQAIERAASLGWDLDRPRAVLIASIDPPVDPAVADRALTTIGASARATLGDDAIVWTRSTSTAALLAPADASARERRDLADALREDLDRRVKSVTLSIGVGRCVDDPTGLPHSFVDAARAVDVGRWAKGRHVTELYDELGLERLFASVPQRDLHDFVLHAIGPLIDHDRHNRSDLVETLSTWLQTRNMAEASRQMFVHYNTFKNRLERIEAILGPVLNDPGRLLEYEVAIHVAHHYDGPWTDTRSNRRGSGGER